MKKRYYIIYFLLATSFVFAQKKQTKYEQEMDRIILLHLKHKRLDSLCYAAHKASVYFYKLSDYKKAIQYALQETRLGKKNLTEKQYKNALFNLGLFYLKDNQHFKSIETYKKVIDSFPINEKTYTAYCEIGRNYTELGDFYQALSYYEKGLVAPDSLKISNFLGQTINFALVYDNIETKETAKKELIILKKADSIFLTSNFSDIRFYSLKNTFGLYYKNDLTFNFNKSRSNYFKVLHKSSFNNDSLIQTTALNNLGELYNKVRNDSAFYFLNRGLKIATLHSSQKPKLHSNLAEYYFIKQQYKNALKELHKSLKIIVPKDIANNYFDIPSIEAIILSNDKYLVLDNLKDKAMNFLCLRSKNKENELLALKHVQLADKLLDIIKAESFETRSKLFWQQKASELYMLGVKSAFRLHRSEEAFYFMEKNKAILLLENIDENELKKEANIPPTVLQKEYLFKKEISDLENLINESPSNLDSLKTKYYDHKIAYKNFYESLKYEYPEYYNYKTPVKILPLEVYQKTIPENQIVIEYFLDDNEGYVLCFTRENLYLNKLKEVSVLLKEIRDYLSLISKPLNTKADLDSCTNKAERLRKLLLPIGYEKTFQNKNRLVIIPDYTLQNLPFESLRKDNKYLIEDFEISYAYSMTFLEKNKKLKRNATQDFIGFAPGSFSYDVLQTLHHSKAETTTIGNELDGFVLLDDKATKESFFSKAIDYKIIHLSTHANANDSIAPWIAFKNKKLYLNELYAKKNQAELVVLNACNSSLGEINAGEGVFSLARGFFHSGANSVVSSLWNVNDKSNAEITTNFYRYLKDGNTKSAALRQAKLDYLNTHTLSEASPYYWSSLILIGDNTSVRLTGNTLYYIFLVVILLLVLFFIFKKRETSG